MLSICMYSQSKNKIDFQNEIYKKDSIIDIQNKALNEKKLEIEVLKKELGQKVNTNNLNHSGTITIDSNDSKTFFEYLFPSLIALIVGLFALFGTIYTGRRQRLSSEIQLKNQLTHSQELVEKQIKSAKETLEAQVESAKKISDSQILTASKTAELNFRQNVLSSNRRDWIEKLRLIISELSAKIIICSIKEEKDVVEISGIFQLIITIELMLNPNDPRDNELVNKLKEIQTEILKKKADIKFGELGGMNKEAINITKKILKDEWERVKKGE